MIGHYNTEMLNGKVRFGVVGTNIITDTVIKGGLQDDRFEVVAVCSRTQETADAFAAKYNIPYTFTSVEEMASSDCIDAVYIATPNSCHAAQAIISMNKGKHVLCEKPLAANADQAKAMIEVAKANNVTLMEAMITTLNPNFQILKENLASLGTLRRYFASFCQYSSRYDRFKDGIVLNAFKPELANGSAMDIGIYTIYPMIALFGKPLQVQAQGVLLHTGVDGQGCANFKYDGLDATVLFSKIANSSLPTEIEGEEGNIILNQIHIPTSVEYVPRVQTEENPRRQIGQPLDKSAYYYEIKEFIDLVNQGKQQSEVNTWANSIATIEVIDEIRSQIGVITQFD